MAIDWTHIPIVQKDMFDRWERFSVGSQTAAKKDEFKFTNPAVAADCVYAYDEANDRVYNAINTTTLVGLVCPDKRDVNFIFDGQLSVFGGGDNDPIGIVIAYVKLPNGETHTLSVMRTMFGQPSATRDSGYWLRAPMTIVKDYMTHAPKAIAESFGILKFGNGRIVTEASPLVPSNEFNAGGSWVSVAPLGVHLRVVREGDIITVESSQVNETALIPETKLTIDLSKDPELEMFRGRSQYGFCSVSQDFVFWTGQIDHPKLATPFSLSDVHAMYGTHGNMTNAAEKAGIWQRDPIDLKAVFNSWKRISRGSRGNKTMQQARLYSDAAIPSEAAAFTYDEPTNRIGNPLNTDTLVGFISPDKFDSYLLDVTITSLSNWQVDPVGLVIAYVVDQDGTAHTLTVFRCGYAPADPNLAWMNQDAPIQVSVDYATHGQVTIAKGYNGLKYNSGHVPTPEDPWMQHPGGAGGSTDWGFDKFPKGVRIVVNRNGDMITITTSQYNEENLHPGAVVSIDLNSHPSLARFKVPCSYGFCSISQDYVSWDATLRPGGWRKPFWMSDFGKRNEYLRQVRGPFNSAASAPGNTTIKYVPALYIPTGQPLDVIVPLRGYGSANSGYTFAKDMFVMGNHITAAELTALGLHATDGLCLQRPSMADIRLRTVGHGMIGYMMFKKDKLFQNPIGVHAFADGELSAITTISIKLPQPDEDTIIIPYIVSDQPVSNISITLRNL